MEEPITEEVNKQDEPTEEVDDTASKNSAGDADADKKGEGDDSSDDLFDGDPFEKDSDKKEDSGKKEEPAKEDAPTEAKFDEDLDSWAVKAGYDQPENDRERKLLQNLRNSQRDFHSNRQAEKAAKTLQDTAEEISKEVIPAKSQDDDDDIDPIEEKVNQLTKDRDAERASRLQSEFYISNNISESTGKVMADILREKVEKASTPEAKAKAVDHWSHPDQLQDLYDLAQARELSSGGTDAVAEAAAAKERERIAKESKAGGPTRSAKSTVPADKKDPLLAIWDE